MMEITIIIKQTFITVAFAADVVIAVVVAVVPAVVLFTAEVVIAVSIAGVGFPCTLFLAS